MNKKVIFVLVFCNLFSQVSAQSSNNIFTHLSPVKFLNLKKKMHSPRTSFLQTIYPSIQVSDLVVGLADPDEAVTITGNYYLNGNIMILNRGVLNIEMANFQIDGDIFIVGQGYMKVEDGTFTVIQEYIYEHQAIVSEGGKLEFKNIDFHSSGQSWSTGLTDSAQYILENVTISDGFITSGFMGQSRGIIANTDLPGEFLCFGNSHLEISNSDFLLMWLVLPDSSTVESSLPDDSLITNWSFSETEPEIQGIPYSVTIDSCTRVMWGLISMTGSKATFSDTEFRTIGLMFTDPDSIVVTNITNESQHNDDIANVPDRELRLINSQVHTWSFYASSNSNIAVNNCVFGEVLSQDSSKVYISNSVCDGTGGYLGAFHNSFLLVVGSLIKSQVICRQTAVLLGIQSAFTGTEIDGDESSIMFIANTASAVEPEAHKSAIIFEAQCPIVEGRIDDEIPILGTARIIHGPLIPIEFTGYSLSYSFDPGHPQWQQINQIYPNAVVNDTLAKWDT